MVKKIITYIIILMKRTRTLLDIEELQERLLESIYDKNHKLVKKLILQGADVDCFNFYGKTPLHIAAERGDKIYIDILLSSGANPDLMDFERLTPLCVAVFEGHHECIEPLVKAEISTNKFENGQNLLHIACIQGHHECILILHKYDADINQNNKHGDIPLHLAIIHNKEKCVEEILSLDGI